MPQLTQRKEQYLVDAVNEHKKTLDDLAPSYAYDQHRGVMFTWDATYKKGQVMEPGTDVLKKKKKTCVKWIQCLLG